MKIDILTLFPNMFKGPFDESILQRAQNKKLVEINIHNLRNYTYDKYKTVDDKPYGGGTGMVMRVDVIERAILNIKNKKTGQKIILLSPRGKLFNQQKAQELSKLDHLIFICGHYEGVDERVSKYLVDEEISIGDYVLTGGELATMVIVDSVVRLIPGVLKKTEATKSESFQPTTNHPSPPIGKQSLITLEFPQYTRPAEYKGWKVPEILLSGNHKKINEWREQQSLAVTKKKRPDLLK